MKESESTGAPPSEGTKPSEGDTGGKEDGKRNINPELWYACAGPLVNVPPPGSLVVYLPQGHSEQVAATMHKNADMQIPSYPNLPWKLICFLHNVNLHADPETDEVYAQMTLQPVNTNDKETFPPLDLATKPNRPQAEFFCKTLTASDTSTHGGFSVPRRAAEKIFPALDFSMQPPAQELKARDLHGNIWTFRHIFRGQPKRHLLTTGWSLFVSGKRLFAGDSVLFVRNEKQQLFVGIRRANRQPTNISSSVLSSDSMQIGVLAAAAHAYANNSLFTVFYNPRASPSEFVIPLAKYNKAIYSNQITLGMRFRMMFETEESGTRRYMGTITSISDLDPVRWKNSKWRNLQVGWDESVSGERRNRVSLWEIEPVQAPFFICPPPFFMSKRLRQPGMPDDELMDTNLVKRVVPWLSDDICMKDNMSQNGAMSGTNLVHWMKMQNVSLSNFASQADHIQSLTGIIQHNYGAMGVSGQLGLSTQNFQQNSIQFNAPKFQQQLQQTCPLPKLSVALDQPSAFAIRCDGLQDINVHLKHQLTVNQSLHSNKTCNNLVQPQTLFQNQVLQQKPQIQGHLPPSTNLVSQTQQLQRQPKPQELQHLSHELLQSQQAELLQLQQQQPSRGLGQQIHQASQQLQLPEQQINVQLPQKLQQQQQCLPTQTMIQQPQKTTEVQQRYLGEKQYLSNDNSLSQKYMALNFSTKGTSESIVKFQSMQCQSTQKLQQSQVITTEMLGNFPQTSSNMPSTTCSNLLNSGGMQSVLTEDIPSCSTSPSAENCTVAPYRVMSKAHCDPLMAEVPCSAIINLNPGSCNPNKRVVSDWKKFDVKPSVSVPKSQNHGTLFPQMFTTSKVEMDFNTPSSTTSVCLPQVDAQSQRSFPVSSFSQQQMPFRDTSQDDVLASNPGVDDAFGINVGSQLGASVLHDSLLMKNVGSEDDYQNPLASDMVSNHGGSKEGQAELSSSIVSKSFGAPDVAFSSIDSTIDDTSLLNQCLRPPPPQLQRMRTYTKVYKRGAVGRSIDITRYSGYDELKRDIARMFSIEGQLEDRQRIGWKLVYVDHEKDVLLVGDDPWEEFVNCVRSIKILSPQEVQQMSLEGDMRGNNAPANQACSSSDCGNTWNDMCDNISGNHSIESYDYF